MPEFLLNGSKDQAEGENEGGHRQIQRKALDLSVANQAEAQLVAEEAPVKVDTGIRGLGGSTFFPPLLLRPVVLRKTAKTCFSVYRKYA